MTPPVARNPSTAAPGAPLRIAARPWRRGDRSNPYTETFYAALRPHGVMCVDDLAVDDAFLRENARRFDALHLEWPEYLWGRPGAPALRRLHNVVGLARYLRLAGKLGLKRMFTIHNVDPHEGSDWIDRLGYRAVARYSDLLIVHTRAAADALRRRDRPRAEVVVMHHGNYAGEYPPPGDRAAARARFDLRADVPVVCCLGLLRDYKGLDTACDACRALDGAVQLVVAGKPFPSFDLDGLKRRVAATPNARLVDRELSPQEFSDLAALSEFALLPYRKITGSGALLAMWTLGRGVVASDLPFFREMFATIPFEAGRLTAADDPVALARAIDEYLRVPSAARTAAAETAAARYSWSACVVPVMEVLSRWRGERSSAAAAPKELSNA